MANVFGAGIPQQVTHILVWGGLLLGAVIVLFGGIWYYRRRWLDTGDDRPGQPWTLDDLRRMKQAGQISDEEYDALREAMVAVFRGKREETLGTGRRDFVTGADATPEAGDPSDG